MRSVDLTGKLGLGGKPTITIGEVVLTVNDGASNLLRVLKMVNDGMDPQAMFDAVELLFDEESREELKSMELSFDDFSTVVATAVDLVLGGGSPKEGTQATTS